jgi:hypothetical protein
MVHEQYIGVLTTRIIRVCFYNKSLLELKISSAFYFHIMALWNTAPYGLVSVYQRFEEHSASKFRVEVYTENEAVCSSET